MKKFYSIVLMATMLLVGTQTWATVHQVATMEQLGIKWASAASGDTIQLTSDVTLDKTLWLGTRSDSNTDAAIRSITFDLNGKLLTTASKAAIRNMFLISHGELNVITSVPGGRIQSNGGYTLPNYDTSVAQEIFRVNGSNKDDLKPMIEKGQTGYTGYYSHLTIGQGVEVNADSLDAIVVDVIQKYWPLTNGSINVEFVGAAGITDGSLPYNGEYGAIKSTDNKKSNGVRIDVAGKLTAKKYAIKVNGDVTYKTDPEVVPFVHLHPTADLSVPSNGEGTKTSKKPVVAYCSGYANWLIEGKCVGATAIYIKAGNVEIKDAVIASNYDGDYIPPTATSAGVTGMGSAIVVESNSNYSGDISVEISGDTKVTAENGYALEEDVTNMSTSEVNHIQITGGTFEGGDVRTAEQKDPTDQEHYVEPEDGQGTIIISKTTNEQTTSQVEVSGGQINGNTEVTGTTDGLNALINTNTTYTTVVTDENGNQTVVVSAGQKPTPVADNFDIDNFTSGNVDLSDDALVNKTQIFDHATKTTLNIATLLMNNATSNVSLRIAAGHTIVAEKVTMNAKAQIIVEAGAALIVTGPQGISGTSVNNIVLETSNTAQAILLIKPTVESNRHPEATVKMLAQGIGYETISATKEWYFHRFALPIAKATSWDKDPNYGTFVYGWNYTTNGWENLSSLSLMEPFMGYTLTANYEGMNDVTYTFKGELAGGNSNAQLGFVKNGFHMFGNSYTGHISIDKLVEQLTGDSELDGTVWVWGADQQYHAVPLMALRNYPSTFDDWQKEIAPMQTFVLKHNVGTTGSTSINYESAIWENPRYNSFTGNSAPRRRVADDNTHMRIIITAENGKSDNVLFVEDATRSDEFENGYDGAKFINENALNMYATVNGENYAVVATDNLEGKTLSINTVEDVNYTMTFAKVNGEEYAVRDNVTGAVFAIVEGASYEFAAQPNSTVEGRFEIVPVAKVPTAIDNTEVKANAKGIYTIMGQYVGEDFNALPAGIYVVDGVKIVK